jgi:hypothetical protein
MYEREETFKQNLVVPMLMAPTAVGIAAADGAALSHRTKKKRTRYVFLLNMARARRKKRRQLAGTAMA